MTALASTLFDTQAQAPIVYLCDPLLERHGVTVAVKREDLLHPLVSGNKWRKLKYNLLYARAEGFDTLLSFGGAYSNHIHALASAGRLMDFTTIGVIRGEEHDPLNPVLSHARREGMRLHFVSREEYRQRHDPRWQRALQAQLGHSFLIPEGGSNELALKGVAEIWDEVHEPFDYIATACGTGGTAAGLIRSAPEATRILAFAVLKGAEFLHRELERLAAGAKTNWRLLLDYHGGGYARLSADLVRFMDRFEARHGFMLDPVYTAKMMYGLYQEVAQERFDAGSRILALHTGGLAGRASMQAAMARLRDA
ncbi:MAG: 1-aminocyclopropane-1-carboxylate deaminase/D-cysteine desulfhydrase [Gammaproteobacteria bacterium]|nr:1-aminocyclopropane-1-carboxylate deaminase/D-cysteine desulfhydrase [Gammaproteobacteria bacterium]